MATMAISTHNPKHLRYKNNLANILFRIFCCCYELYVKRKLVSIFSRLLHVTLLMCE